MGVILFFKGDMDADLSRLRKLDGITCQIIQDLAEPAGISPYKQRNIRVNGA